MKTIALAAALLLACGASTPSPTDQAAVASYATALEACIASAKLRDAGMADYHACKAKVDAMWGVVDAGGAP